MIGRDEALALCEHHFPDGLERLIERLSVRVERSDIGDVDGWCYSLPDGRRVVRLCSTKTRERQRFTLAHELAHFLIDSQSRRWAIFRDVYDPRSVEEREADELASRLLLPTKRVREVIGSYVIDYRTIKRLMNKAKVSDIVVALRLAKSESLFDLDRPTIVRFDGDQISWSFPSSRDINRNLASHLFRAATQSPDKTVTKCEDDGTVVIGSRLPNINYPTLFYYHAAPDATNRSPIVEELNTLEEYLFSDDDPFRRSLNGCIGGNKKRLLEMEEWEKIDFVIRWLAARNSDNSDRMKKIESQQCYEYLGRKMDDLT